MLYFFKRLAHILGFRHRNIINLIRLGQYFSDRRTWKKMGGKVDYNFPILIDKNDYSGNAKGHYFHQDLLVAQFIFKDNPESHIDIGSRIDGFVAHVAAFRKIEIWDIRTPPLSEHQNITFRQVDIMAPIAGLKVKSLSCLHSLEHFGLGRYGDQINTQGHLTALKNMITLLEDDALFYISFPIDSKNEVHFNAHRVFSPTWIISLPFIQESLLLKRFDYIDQHGSLHKNVECKEGLEGNAYGCGIYTFKKIKNDQ